MESYNNVMLFGKAVKDAKVQRLSTYSIRAEFTLSVVRSHKICEGVNPVDFLRIICYGDLATLAREKIKKGSEALISGRIQTAPHEICGETKWIMEIIANSITIKGV